MKLIYHRNGDYLLPDLGLAEAEQRPVGKYGRMHLRYLEEHRPGLYTRLLLSGKLMEHLHEIDSTCQERLEQLTCQMQTQEGLTEALKASNQMPHDLMQHVCRAPCGAVADFVRDGASPIPRDTNRLLREPKNRRMH